MPFVLLLLFFVSDDAIHQSISSRLAGGGCSRTL